MVAILLVILGTIYALFHKMLSRRMFRTCNKFFWDRKLPPLPPAGNNVGIQKSSRVTMQAFCECGFVQTLLVINEVYSWIYTHSNLGWKHFLIRFCDIFCSMFYVLVCLEIAETIQKSIIYVRNLLKVVLPESGNVCWHRHLADISAT